LAAEAASLVEKETLAVLGITQVQKANPYKETPEP
jgi:hypothetical protein